MGDPAGCGPEITVKALLHDDIYKKCRPLVVGDANVIEHAVQICGTSDMRVHCVASPNEGVYTPGTIDVYHLDLIDVNRLVYGKVSAACGNAAYQCVKRVIEMALSESDRRLV